jgi:hypothetical protein
MLWLKTGDKVLFRNSPRHTWEIGTWNESRNKIKDVFGFWVGSDGITYEGQICVVGLPGTYMGMAAFCLCKPMDYAGLVRRVFHLL